MNTGFLFQVYAGNCMHRRSGSKRMNNQVDDHADDHDHEEGADPAAPHSLALHSFGAKYTQHSQMHDQPQDISDHAYPDKQDKIVAVKMKRAVQHLSSAHGT